MRLLEQNRFPTIPLRAPRLTHRRLSQPTRLPRPGGEGGWRHYLDRLRWLFGGG